MAIHAIIHEDEEVEQPTLRGKEDARIAASADRYEMRKLFHERCYTNTRQSFTGRLGTLGIALPFQFLAIDPVVKQGLDRRRELLEDLTRNRGHRTIRLVLLFDHAFP